MSLKAPLFVLTVAVAVNAGCGKSARRHDGSSTGGRGGTTAGSGASDAGSHDEAGAAAEGDTGGKNGDGTPAGGTAGTGGAGGRTTSGLGGAPGAGRAGSTSGGATSANAGATNGGAPSAGGANGSAAGAPTIAVPDGCVASDQHVGGSFCSSDVICGGDHFIVSCNPSTTDAGVAGPWSCSCTRGEPGTEFVFPVATGAPTCVAAADACVHPELVTGADDNCVLTAPGDATSCTAVESCNPMYEVDGVALTLNSTWSADCRIYGGNRASCSCGDSPTADHYALQTDGLQAGCDFLKPLCLGNPPVAGAWSCVTDWDQTDVGCDTGWSCTRSLTLDDGSTLTEVDQFEAQCGDSSAGTGADCKCGNEEDANVITLRSNMSAADEAACHLAIGACVGAPALALERSPSCTPSNAQASGAYCQQTLDCSQDATSGGTPVTVLTSATATCQQQNDGTWNCTCSSGATLTLDAADAMDASDACNRAVTECPKLPVMLL